MKPTREQIEHRAIEILRTGCTACYSCKHWNCDGHRDCEDIEGSCSNEIVETALEQAEKELSKPKLSEDEKVILRNISKHYKWIARDDEGDLEVLDGEWTKCSSVWSSNVVWNYLEPLSGLFQFITWEDDEPYNIEELLNG